MKRGRIKSYTAITFVLSCIAGALACFLMTILYGPSDYLAGYIITIIIGFSAVWICYLGIIFSIAGLWDEDNELYVANERNPSFFQWLVLQFLVCFAIVFEIWRFISGISLRPLKPIYIIETLLLYPFGFNLILTLWITAGMITVFRKRWGVYFLLITCMWMFTLELFALPNLISHFKAAVYYGEIGYLTFSLGLFRLRLIHVALLIALAVTSAIFTKRYLTCKNEIFKKIHNYVTYKGRYLSVAILLALTALGLQWFNCALAYRDLSFIRTLLLVLAAILVMLGQLFSRSSILIPATVALPVIFLAFGYFGGYVNNIDRRQLVYHVEIWGPLILLGLIAAFKKNITIRLRVVVVLVPVMFMFLSYIVPFEKTGWITPEYSTPFPKYLEPPEGSTLHSFHPTHSFNPNYYDPPNFIGVKYEVNEPYPSPKVLDFLAKEFEVAGFSKLDYDLEFPTIPSSHLEGWFPRKAFTYWEAYWLRETDNVLLKVHLWCYDQKTQVTIEANKPIGWSHRAIKLRHQIQFYKQVQNKKDVKK